MASLGFDTRYTLNEIKEETLSFGGKSVSQEMDINATLLPGEQTTTTTTLSYNLDETESVEH